MDTIDREHVKKLELTCWLPPQFKKQRHYAFSGYHKGILKINIGSEHVHRIPDTVRNLQHLTNIWLYGCCLEADMSLFQHCTKLVNIRLDKISIVGESIAFNEGLTHIYMYECKLKSLNMSDLISALPNTMTEIRIMKMQESDGRVISLDGLNNLSRLEYLNLEMLTPLVFPSKLDNMTSLKTIKIDECENIELLGISDLTALKDLQISRSKLSSIPESLLALTQLTRLDLSHNELGCTTLGDILYRLTNLETLYMSDNWINQDIYYVGSTYIRYNLRRLYLDDCGICGDVHDNILDRLKLPNLVSLDLRNNGWLRSYLKDSRLRYIVSTSVDR